jgi:hypothetical protein
VSIEELRLGLATIGTLAVPPALSTTVDGVVGSAGNDNVGAGDTDERPIPLLVAEGGLAVEDDLYTESDQICHVSVFIFSIPLCQTPGRTGPRSRQREPRCCLAQL